MNAKSEKHTTFLHSAESFSWPLLIGGMVLGMAVLGLTPVAEADQFASGERQAAAIGHYAKARSLLVAALEEFEIARGIAQPDMLLDPEQWRMTIVSRTEELNRVLDPRPRITQSGVRFKADPRLIGRSQQRVPAPEVNLPVTPAPVSPPAPVDGTEQQVQPMLTPPVALPQEASPETASRVQQDAAPSELAPAVKPEQAAPSTVAPIEPASAPVAAQKVDAPAAEQSEEDINQAIEWAIQERLRKLEAASETAR